MIEVGVLVKFSPPDIFAGTADRYPSFGVVVGKKEPRLKHITVKPAWEVQWINGTTTTEHQCYLKEASHDNL